MLTNNWQTTCLNTRVSICMPNILQDISIGGTAHLAQALQTHSNKIWEEVAALLGNGFAPQAMSVEDAKHAAAVQLASKRNLLDEDGILVLTFERAIADVCATSCLKASAHGSADMLATGDGRSNESLSAPLTRCKLQDQEQPCTLHWTACEDDFVCAEALRECFVLPDRLFGEESSVFR